MSRLGDIKIKYDMCLEDYGNLNNMGMSDVKWLIDVVESLKVDAPKPLCTTEHFPDQTICLDCVHCKSEQYHNGGTRQIITGPCTDCYGKKVFIVKNFKGK